MTVEVQPYFAEGERYPALIGVRVEGDEYETAYVSKSELVDALAENAKLRQFCARLSHALNLGGKWCGWACKVEFGCNMDENCPVERELCEMGIEVDW